MKSILKRVRKENGGFTLVELLIVVAIIAILAAIAIPQFSKYKMRGYQAKIQSDAKNAYAAAQAYLTDYPTGMVDTEAKLLQGGFKLSPNIRLSGGGMTNSPLSYIELRTSDPLVYPDNTATILQNGRIRYPAGT